MTATIFDISRCSYVDGPGIRTTVFFKGCNLRCAWCHNPESQRPEKELMFFRNKCTGCGKCTEKCPNALSECDLCGTCTVYCPADAREVTGKDYTVAEVLSEVLKDRTFYETSNGGVTFSGGECMMQIDFLEEILTVCKNQGLHTAVDTAGHVPFEHFERILGVTDLFLYDVKCFDSALHKRYTGVGNERILGNLKKLLSKGARVWVRIPVIPGVNDSVGEMTAIHQYLIECGYPERVELLPYHAMGEHKYEALNKELTRFSAPDSGTLDRLREIFLG